MISAEKAGLWGAQCAKFDRLWRFWMADEIELTAKPGNGFECDVPKFIFKCQDWTSSALSQPKIVIQSSQPFARIAMI